MRYIIAVLLLVSSTAWGIDSEGHYQSLRVSCGDFIAARKKGEGADWYYGWFVQGYISAYNAISPNTYNIYGNTDFTSAMLWMENWCNANPLKGLTEGMIVLTNELYPRRHKTAKEAGR